MAIVFHIVEYKFTIAHLTFVKQSITAGFKELRFVTAGFIVTRAIIEAFKHAGISCAERSAVPTAHQFAVTDFAVIDLAIAAGNWNRRNTAGFVVTRTITETCECAGITLTKRRTVAAIEQITVADFIGIELAIAAMRNLGRYTAGFVVTRAIVETFECAGITLAECRAIAAIERISITDFAVIDLAIAAFVDLGRNTFRIIVTRAIGEAFEGAGIALAECSAIESIEQIAVTDFTGIQLTIAAFVHLRCDTGGFVVTRAIRKAFEGASIALTECSTIAAIEQIAVTNFAIVKLPIAAKRITCGRLAVVMEFADTFVFAGNG